MLFYYEFCFFFKQKTAYEMRISDWSSDVCSSDLHAQGSKMGLLRIRLTGSDDAVRAVINLLQSLDGIEHVEEIGDLMTHMDDADSSSAGLSDVEGPQMHEIEIGVPNESTGRKVRAAGVGRAHL